MKFACAAALTLLLVSTTAPVAAQDFDPMAMADTNTDGKVDLKEATSFTEQGWGFADQAGAGKIKKETLPDFFQPSFASAKVDAEGYVTKEAYIAAVPERFKAADANADGFLSEPEIRAFLGMP